MREKSSPPAGTEGQRDRGDGLHSSVRPRYDFQQPPLFDGHDVPVQRTAKPRRRPAAPPADGWSRTVARQKCHACLIRLGEVDGPAPLVRTARFVWRDGGHASYLCPECAAAAGCAVKR